MWFAHSWRVLWDCGPFQTRQSRNLGLHEWYRIGPPGRSSKAIRVSALTRMWRLERSWIGPPHVAGSILGIRANRQIRRKVRRKLRRPVAPLCGGGIPGHAIPRKPSKVARTAVYDSLRIGTSWRSGARRASFANSSSNSCGRIGLAK